jgi:ABC-type sugar transport system ATPase subunit
VTDAVLRLDAVGKTFPGVRALAGVSLDVRAGEVLGLVGENGAGKSTLIKIVGGVYPHGSYEGAVLLGGQARRFASAADALAAGVAVVHQELSLVPGMSVAENLLLGREPRRFGFVDGARLVAEARAMLARTVADEDAGAIDPEAAVETLGVGRQQVVEIARALGADARVVFLDEPTAALTDQEAARLHELVRAGRARGAAFVYVSHRLDEIFALCDRVAVLRDGKLVAVRATTEVTRDEIVALMTGKTAGTLARPEPETAPGPEVLRVDGLTLAHPTLPGRRVLDGVSLAVRAGEVVALAGAMGAGRTALLSALFGLARGKVGGAARLADAAFAPRAPADAIARGVALVPEDRKHHGLVLGQSVADNLTIASLASAFFDPAAAERTAQAAARDLGVKAPGLDALVDTLSGGNQQKVVLAKWLLTEPRLLLLDEPTRGVDVGARAEIFRIIRRLTTSGLAVLMASSDLEEIRLLADRVVVLREGRVAGELAGAAATPDAIMALAVGTAGKVALA